MDLEKRNFLFYDSCRLCLEELGSCNIFLDETHLPRDIFICTGIKVSVTDDLPEKICKTCYEIIKRAIDFREIVAKNDQLLRSLLADAKNEEVKELSYDKIASEEINSRYFIKDPCAQNSQVITNETEKDSNKSPGSENTCNSSPPLKLISVRKDLFEKSEQNSPTKDSDKEDSNEQKRQKVERTEVVAYRCDTCSKNFKTWKKLYLHSRLHNKTNVCPLDNCEKKFATKGDLEKHIRTHTGEKPYKCSTCDRSFAQRVSLRCHIEAVHNGEIIDV